MAQSCELIIWLRNISSMIGGSERKEYSYSESDAPEMFDKLLEK